MLIDKDTIIKNFSKNAESYDSHSNVQKTCAELLLALVGDDGFSKILEVGCGTGTYTRMLRKTNKDSHITAVDISSDMVRVAEEKCRDTEIDFLIMDAESLDLDSKYDLITSNASFQWIGDLDSLLGSFSSMLDDKGVLCFSIYGPDTFKEFRDALGAYSGKKLELTAGSFLGREGLTKIIDNYFHEFIILEESFDVKFSSVLDFLRDIKKSGTRGKGIGDDIFFGKNALKEIEKYYIDTFDEVKATHHIYFCKAFGYKGL